MQWQSIIWHPVLHVCYLKIFQVKVLMIMVPFGSRCRRFSSHLEKFQWIQRQCYLNSMASVWWPSFGTISTLSPAWRILALIPSNQLLLKVKRMNANSRTLENGIQQSNKVQCFKQRLKTKLRWKRQRRKMSTRMVTLNDLLMIKLVIRSIAIHQRQMNHMNAWMPLRRKANFGVEIPNVLVGAIIWWKTMMNGKRSFVRWWRRNKQRRPIRRMIKTRNVSLKLGDHSQSHGVTLSLLSAKVLRALFKGVPIGCKPSAFVHYGDIVDTEWVYQINVPLLRFI